MWGTGEMTGSIGTGRAAAGSVDEKRVRRFEAAWVAGAPESVLACLPDEGDPSRLPTLEELVRIELEFAWARWAKSRRVDKADGSRTAGAPPLLEKYLEEFPALDDSQRLTRLLQQEYHHRLDAGIRSPLSEYCQRFPALFENEDEAALLLRRENSLVDSAWNDTTLAPSAPRAVSPNDETLGAVSLEEDGKEDVVREVAGYRIMGELGRGGMGLVYKALDPKLNRVVALKMVLAGDHAGPEDHERFQREARAIAQLQHPHIVQIFEVGEENGLPFFVLEFIRGGSLDRQVDGKPRNPRQAADLVETLALAMQSAHEQGIIHRDLKPANVLMAPGRTPKITDFGLAKQLEDSQGQTATGAVIGTPSYMAPEQASGDSQEIGPAADIYALGAILYTLITGRPPFQGETAFDTIMQVIEQEALPPTRLQSKIPRDLETICLKCLLKDPERRYETAQALADDLRRFLEHRPIVARPIGWVERGVKWVRRKPAIAALVGLLMLSPLVGWGFIVNNQRFLSQKAILDDVSMLVDAQSDDLDIKNKALYGQLKKTEQEADRANREAESAKASARKAETRAYFSDMLLAQRDWEDNSIGHLRGIIRRYQTREDLKGFEWDYWSRLADTSLVTLSRDSRSSNVSFSPDGRTIVSGSSDNTVKVWNSATGQEMQTFKGHANAVECVGFSPDGTRVVSGSTDSTLRLWDRTTGQVTWILEGHSGAVRSVGFSPDGKTIVSGSSDKTVKFWDAATGKETRTLKGHTNSVECVSFSPSGMQVASGGGIKVKVWDAQTGKPLLTFSGHSRPVEAVAFSPDGKRIVSGAYTVAKVWDVQTGKERHTLRGHTNRVQSVCFSPDGTRIVSGSRDNTIRIWDSRTGKETLTLKGHSFWVESVAFSPDGTRIVSGSADNTVKIWDSEKSQEAIALSGHEVTASCVNFSPDGTRIVSGGHDRVVRVWDSETGQETLSLEGHTDFVVSVASSPDGKWVVSGSWDRTVKVWDAETGQEVRSLQGHSGRVTSVDVSCDGRLIASGSDDQTVKVWDTATGQEMKTLRGHSGSVYSVNFSPDGTRIVSGGHDGLVKIWDVETGRGAQDLKGHASRVNCVRFSPDGKQIVSGSSDRSLKIWDAGDGELEQTLQGHAKPVTCVSFLADSGRIVSGGHDNTVKVWDSKTGQETLSLKGHANFVTSVNSSPDGKRIASGSLDRTVRVWDSRPIPGAK